MEIELERTFLLKNIPAGLKKCKSIEIIDIYLPKSARHPILRIRKRGDIFEITKKCPLVGVDSSEQGEYTISLAREEFEGLSQVEGKKFRKIRYFYPFDGKTAEVDIYQDDFGSRAELQKHFLNIKDYRNGLMHVREMNRVERKQGEASVEWLLKILDKNKKLIK